MFETLTERLGQSFSLLKGRKELTDENIDEGLRQVRTALLEADVQFQLARDFTQRVRERALGGKRLKGVEASDQFVHAVHEELVEKKKGIEGLEREVRGADARRPRKPSCARARRETRLARILNETWHPSFSDDGHERPRWRFRWFFRSFPPPPPRARR